MDEYKAFDKLPLPVIVVDSDYKVVYANKKAHELYVHPPTTCYEFTHGYTKPCYEEEKKEACPVKMLKEESKECIGVIHSHVTKSGEEVFYILSCRDTLPDRYIEVHINVSDIMEAFKFGMVRPEVFFGSGPMVIFLWERSPGWPVKMVSPNVKDIFGYTARDFMEGRVSYAEIIHPDDIERVAREVEENTKKKSSSWTHQNYRIIAKDGEVKWLLDHTVPIFDENGEITHYYGYVMDVSDTHEKEEIIQTIFSNAPLGILIFDPASNKVILANQKLSKMTENLEELVSKLSHMKRKKTLKFGKRYFKVERHPIRYLGRELFLAMFTDITEEKELEKRLYKLATRDKLTCIYNRHALYEFLDKMIKQAERDLMTFSVVFFDIDGFKQINDTFGHQVGDDVLVSIANLVKRALRKSDIFGRWGGEEFLIILPNSKDPVLVAERLRKLVQETIRINGSSITISVGVTNYKKGDSITSIIKRVDNAMYSAKMLGKNRTVFAG